jgi:hypothetical protein
MHSAAIIVGAIVTARGEAAPGRRETAGVDFSMATSQFLGTQVLDVSGFYLNSTKVAGTRGGAAFGGRINLPNDPWNIRLSVREFQDGYDPALGFVSAPDIACSIPACAASSIRTASR